MSMSLLSSSRKLLLNSCHHNLRHLKSNNSSSIFSGKGFATRARGPPGGSIPKLPKSTLRKSIFTLRSVPLVGGGVALGIVIGYGSLVSDSKHLFPVVEADAGVRVDACDTKKGTLEVGGGGAAVGRKDEAPAEGGKDKKEAEVQVAEGDKDSRPEAGDKKEEHFDWGQLFEIIAPHWKRVLVAVGSALAVAVINIEIPAYLGKLVNIVSSQLMTMGGELTDEARKEFLEKLMQPAITLFLMYMGQALCTFSYIYNLGVVGEGFAMDLRLRLFASLLSQDAAFFDSHMTGELVSRLTADIQDFKSSFKQCLSGGLRSITQIVGCVVSLYFVSKEMTITVIGVVPTIILIGSLFTRGLRVLSRKAQMQLSDSSGHAEETLSNIRTVKAFAMEEQELLQYKLEIEELRRLNVELSIGIGIFQGGSNLFLNAIVLGVIYAGGRLISAERLSPGDLMYFLVASQTIQRSLANMSLLFGQYVRGIGAGTRVFHYINLNPANSGEVREAKGIIPPNFQGDIEFKNVTFSYPTRPEQVVLEEFSLKLPHGKVVAVVGASGSGKSTLANIIEGFYNPQGGSVTIDGHSIDNLSTKWLRGEAVGLINQEPVLFATTIMENIRYGKPNATDEEVWEAAKKANAYDFIMEFPDGFNTIMGERGVTVSGGQRQRLAIARALIKKPKILLLDEATSALDAESERLVQKALDSAVHGRTVLIIAHRLSTVKNADNIAVMSFGRIVEMGTHDNLMAKKGFYYNLVKQQEFMSKSQ